MEPAFHVSGVAILVSFFSPTPEVGRRGPYSGWLTVGADHFNWPGDPGFVGLFAESVGRGQGLL